MLDMLKGSLKSQTVQFNAVAIVLWVLSVVAASDFVMANPDYVAIAAGVQSLVNVLLRFKTSKPLSER